MDITHKNLLKIQQQNKLIERYKQLIEDENSKIINKTNLKIFENNSFINKLKQKLNKKRQIKFIIYK